METVTNTHNIGFRNVGGERNRAQQSFCLLPFCIRDGILRYHTNNQYIVDNNVLTHGTRRTYPARGLLRDNQVVVLPTTIDLLPYCLFQVRQDPSKVLWYIGLRNYRKPHDRTVLTKTQPLGVLLMLLFGTISRSHDTGDPTRGSWLTIIRQ